MSKNTSKCKVCRKNSRQPNKGKASKLRKQVGKAQKKIKILITQKDSTYQYLLYSRNYHCHLTSEQIHWNLNTQVRNFYHHNPKSTSEANHGIWISSFCRAYLQFIRQTWEERSHDIGHCLIFKLSRFRRKDACLAVGSESILTIQPSRWSHDPSKQIDASNFRCWKMSSLVVWCKYWDALYTFSR